jgi:Flp pilus assembly protein TadG
MRDRGSSSVQVVIILPVLFLVVLTGLQVALMYQARSLALAAAQEGARTAAVEGGTSAAGISAASSFMSASKAGVTGTKVTGNRSATSATVRVTTTSLSVVPGWKPTITQSASMPVERITR